jgi:hypothetical protein
VETAVECRAQAQIMRNMAALVSATGRKEALLDFALKWEAKAEAVEGWPARS